MKIFLDSNIYIHSLVSDKDTVKFKECSELFDRIESSGKIMGYYSAVVSFEVAWYLKDILKCTQKDYYESVQSLFSLVNDIQFLNSERSFQLAQKFSLLLPDAFIAQAVLDNQLILCSYDKDFDRVEGLVRKTPREILISC